MTGDEAVLAVVDGLESVGIPYMLVGSFSSNVYGIARSTNDADFVVELGTHSIRNLVDKMGSKFDLDPQMSFESITMTFRYILHVKENRFAVEIFLLSDDPHDQERFRRRRRIKMLGKEVMLPTPEDVVITKLRWGAAGGRAKDHEDVRDVIAVQGGRIDWDYVHHWVDLHGTRADLEQIRASIPGV